MKPDEKKYWLDQPANITRLVYGVYALCAALLLADLFYHKHAHFAFENWFGFYAFFGFGAYFCIVISARLLRRLIRRDENYYGEADNEVSASATGGHHDD